MCDVSMVNKTAIIAQNPKVTAINSCIEVDLTGQVVSDSIGTRMYSGEPIFALVQRRDRFFHARVFMYFKKRNSLLLDK